MKRHQELPKTLHEVLQIAIDDMIMVSKRENVNFDLEAWYEDLPNGNCKICMAGAVMIRVAEEVYETHISENIVYDILLVETKSKWYKVFVSLNALRRGHIEAAVDVFYDNDADKNEKAEAFLAEYEHLLRYFSGRMNKKKGRFSRFIASMQSLQNELKRFDL